MFRLAIICCLVCTGALSAERPAWEPAKTWVFAVGVLKFDDPKLRSYPDEGRVDAVLIETLRKRGVAEDRICHLQNEEATLAHVTAQLTEFLRKPAQGDTLIFYYTGHGTRDFRDPSRPVNFITYDTKSKWTVRSMVQAIESSFKGSTVILAADCCHSGALADEASRFAGSKQYGVLASSLASSVSTNNWTFTQCLVDIFSGNALVDINGDGEIRFQEAGAYCDTEMSFSEQQRACHATGGRFADQTILSRATAKKSPRAGEVCEARFGASSRKAKILQTENGKCLVQWIGNDKERPSNVWLPLAQILPFEPTALAIGTSVLAEWNGTWYKGRVLEHHMGLHKVHYAGFPPTDDEWVPWRRLRPLF